MKHMFHIFIILSLFFSNFAKANDDLALHNFVSKGDAKGLEEFLDKNGSNLIENVNPEHMTPLLLAADLGEHEIVKILLNNGASVGHCMEHYNLCPLHIAAMKGHKDIAIHLIEFGSDVNSKDNEGMTPLRSIRKDDVEMVKILLDKGAKIDEPDIYGNTFLLYAAQNGSIEVVKCLLERGANPNAQNNVKYSPLHSAARNGHAEIVRMLLDFGALAEIESDYGTALKVAKEKENNNEVIDLLTIYRRKLDFEKKGFTYFSPELDEFCNKKELEELSALFNKMDLLNPENPSDESKGTSFNLRYTPHQESILEFSYGGSSQFQSFPKCLNGLLKKIDTLPGIKKEKTYLINLTFVKVAFNINVIFSIDWHQDTSKIPTDFLLFFVLGTNFAKHFLRIGSIEQNIQPKKLLEKGGEVFHEKDVKFLKTIESKSGAGYYIDENYIQNEHKKIVHSTSRVFTKKAPQTPILFRDAITIRIFDFEKSPEKIESFLAINGLPSDARSMLGFPSSSQNFLQASQPSSSLESKVNSPLSEETHQLLLYPEATVPTPGDSTFLIAYSGMKLIELVDLLVYWGIIEKPSEELVNSLHMGSSLLVILTFPSSISTSTFTKIFSITIYSVSHTMIRYIGQTQNYGILNILIAIPQLIKIAYINSDLGFAQNNAMLLMVGFPLTASLVKDLNGERKNFDQHMTTINQKVGLCLSGLNLLSNYNALSQDHTSLTRKLLYINMAAQVALFLTFSHALVFAN